MGITVCVAKASSEVLDDKGFALLRCRPRCCGGCLADSTVYVARASIESLDDNGVARLFAARPRPWRLPYGQYRLHRQGVQ